MWVRDKDATGGHVEAMSMSSQKSSDAALARLARRIKGCEACPRLVSWREEVAREKRRAFAAETYWGRPVPGFGDPAARILIVGLAPGAHGANRTGRPFTGDRSGQWLYRALHRAGLSSRAESVRAGDGLRLRRVWITNLVRCVPPQNRPTGDELKACSAFLDEELRLLGRVRVVLALGGTAWNQSWKTLGGATPHPRFGHLAHAQLGGKTLLGSYHPSQQNTFTGRLTEPMFDEVFTRARSLAALPKRRAR